MSKKFKCPNPDCECMIELGLDDKRNLIAKVIDAKPDPDPDPEPIKSEDDLLEDLLGMVDGDPDPDPDPDQKV